MAIVQIAAIVHYRPDIHAKTAIIICVIEVWQAEAVAELMAGGTDTIDRLIQILVDAISPKFRRHAIGIELLTIISTFDALCLQYPLMWPDIIAVSALGLAIAGTDKEDLVYLSVVVPVIVGKIHVFCGLVNALHHHRCGVDIINLIITFTGNSAITGQLTTGRIGADDIKVDFQLTIALLQEKVSHRTSISILMIALFVEEAIVCGLRVSRSELHV